MGGWLAGWVSQERFLQSWYLNRAVNEVGQQSLQEFIDGMFQAEGGADAGPRTG